MSTRAASVVALLSLIAGCSPAPPDAAEPEVEPERCVLPDDVNGVPAARALVLGEGSPDAFAAYVEGGAASLTAGFQGGYMVTPRVRVEALAGDGDSACWQVKLSNEMDLEWVAPGLVMQLRFYRHGDAFYSDAINNLLSYDENELLGQPLQLDVSAYGEGLDEAFAVSVMLE